MNSYLDVNGIAFPETLLELIEGVHGVSIEDVEMADTVFAEEGSGHGSVESKAAEVRRVLRRNIVEDAYFHISPIGDKVARSSIIGSLAKDATTNHQN
jgi:hypothetical protein